MQPWERLEQKWGEGQEGRAAPGRRHRSWEKGPGCDPRACWGLLPAPAPASRRRAASDEPRGASHGPRPGVVEAVTRGPPFSSTAPCQWSPESPPFPANCPQRVDGGSAAQAGPCPGCGKPPAWPCEGHPASPGSSEPKAMPGRARCGASTLLTLQITVPSPRSPSGSHGAMNVPLVCDFGTGFSKVGFSGAEVPLAVFPTVLGRFRHSVSDRAPSPGCCSAWRWPPPAGLAQSHPQSGRGPRSSSA